MGFCSRALQYAVIDCTKATSRQTIHGYAQVSQLSKKRFDYKRFRFFLGLTFAVSAVVTGSAAYLSGAPGVSAVIWQSLAMAVLVGAGAGWLVTDRVTGPVAGRETVDPANDASAPHDPAEAYSGPRALASLEEQGITIKLLELTALGERYGNTFSVAMIGVDHIEDVRETYDQDVFEQLLQRVSEALAHTLRMPDRVGELGNGAYLVVLPETGLPGAIQIAERLRAAVSRLDVAVSSRIHIHTTASVGVTSFRRGDDLQSLIHRAEKALRGAQKQGRNRVLPDMAA